MTHGGTNKTSSIAIPPAKALGWDKAQRIWWRALTRMTADTSLAGLATETIAATVAFGYDLEPVACAWVAVGVNRRESVAGIGVTCGAGGVDQSIVGYWDWAGWGEWGTMSIDRVGTQLRGVYTYRTGSVLLGERDADGWYRGCWTEGSRDPNVEGEYGEVWFRMRSDGTLDGRWHHLVKKGWREDWDLSRTTKRDIPAEDRARLTDATQFVPCK
jgi:hypothetical protein